MKTLKLKANHRLFIDDSCNVLVVGNFTGIVDFDPDSSIFNLDAGPFGGSIYLLKLDSAGTFIWANNLNNLGNTIFYGFIKEDNQGNLYIGSEISNLSTIIKLDGGGNLLWTKSFGNTSCNVLEMDIDDSGNMIIGGKFSSIVDFDPDLGTAMLDASTGEIFLTKWNSTGQLIWAKNFGGNNSPKDMAIDRNNRIVITGSLSYSADFDPGIGVSILLPNSSHEIPFYVQFDSLGNYLWANTINGRLYCTDICTDSLSNILMTGNFYGIVDFDPDTSTYNLPYSGSSRTFVCKFDSYGNFNHAVAFESKVGNFITTGLNNDVFVTGSFKEISDMDPSGQIFNLQTEMDNSIFISKLDSSFNFQWAQSIVGSELNVVGHHSDDNGNSYTTGVFSGTVDFDPDTALNLFESINKDKIFIRKLNSEGDMVWLKMVDGAFNGYFQILKSDYYGNVFLLGIMSDTSDMDPGPGIYNLNLPANSTEAYFILKLDSSGNFEWAKVLANKPFQTSDTLNYISDMVVDGSGSIILFGTFETFLDADPGPGTYNLSSQDAEVYLLKLNSAGIFEWVKQIGNPNNYLESNSIKLDGFGNIYLSGFFIEEVDFDPGPGIFLEYPNDWAPSFILKLNPNGEFIWVRQISFYDGYGSVTYTPELEVSDDGTWYATALFEGCLDFDPGNGVDTVWAATNGVNYYISKWSSSGSLIWKVITPQVVNNSYSNRQISIFEDYSKSAFWSAPFGNSTLLYIMNDTSLISSQLGIGTNGFAIDGIDQHNQIYTCSTISNSIDFDFSAANQTVILSGINDVVIAKYHINNPVCSVSPSGIASNKAGNTFCLGQDVVLTQMGGRLSAGGNFKWYIDSCGGTLLGNGPGIVVTPTDTTTYFLRTEDSCGVSTCLSITLYSKIPTSPPTLTGNGLFCSGDSIYLDAGPGYAGYVWSTGSLAQTTSITSNGQYHVTVTDANGCTSSSSINATTYPVPLLTVSPYSPINMCLGDTVQFVANFDPDYTYQWYRNSNPISGANNYYFNAFSNGRYSVKVTDLNMCDSVSSSVRLRIVCFPPMEPEVKISGSDSEEGPAFNLNYESNIEKLFLHAEKLHGVNYALQIFDLSGRLIFDKMGKIENFTLNYSLDCSSFANSMYLVTIKTDSEQLKSKFVKY
ncbi:MAG: SBBP repeat-containing protein [Bacteroidetes bacterium]|nr:SBBP repeat-containing protein [Bacteroidota bacterium]